VINVLVKFREPMLCREVKEADLPLFSGGEWVCQDKLDGVRGVLFVKGGEVVVQGRRNFMSVRYPEFQGIFGKEDDFVLDCEIVTKDRVFNHIQIRDQNNNPSRVAIVSKVYPAVACVFDILELNGRDLTGLPFSERYAILRSNIKPNGSLGILDVYDNISKRFLEVKQEQGEGIILKRKDSQYHYGSRSDGWLKCKNWKEARVLFDKYEVNNAGITVENPDGVRVLVAGRSGDVVRGLIDAEGSVVLDVQYLEITKNGVYRMPTFKGISEV
jgi:ATP-dependent DNA ligase